MEFKYVDGKWERKERKESNECIFITKGGNIMNIPNEIAIRVIILEPFIVFTQEIFEKLELFDQSEVERRHRLEKLLPDSIYPKELRSIVCDYS